MDIVFTVHLKCICVTVLFLLRSVGRHALNFNYRVWWEVEHRINSLFQFSPEKILSALVVMQTGTSRRMEVQVHEEEDGKIQEGKVMLLWFCPCTNIDSKNSWPCLHWSWVSVPSCEHAARRLTKSTVCGKSKFETNVAE